MKSINTTPFDYLKRNPKPYSQAQRSYPLDRVLLNGLFLLAVFGLVILYSAGNQDLHLLKAQLLRLGCALVLMIGLAWIPPLQYRRLAYLLYAFSLFLLIGVLIIGHIGHGAQRWLDLGLFRFQPSELMKFALPLMLAVYFDHRELPPSFRSILFATGLILFPALLTAKQPDLGTAILIAGSGTCVLFLAGLQWQLLLIVVLGGISSAPVLWHFMHDYQKERIFTLLNPEQDPLGTGYHIIQSKIAIGSGGVLGKGWLAGSQAHLAFLPEHSTDFIFAVAGEEFGLVGCATLIFLYLLIAGRCLYLSLQAQDTFSRLMCGSVGLILFTTVFINIGMVSGILPVVGVPLPLVSYGGTSIITIAACFGVVLSITRHRKLLSR